MERKSCFIRDVICILIITVVVNARVAAAEVEEFDFYKTQVTWPQSFCNGEGIHCEKQILDYFTLYALIPMYSNNTVVPPYGLSRNCTDQIPTSREKLIIYNFDDELLRNMTKYMPNIKNPKASEANRKFWLRQWDGYGMCFKKSDQPEFYYETALIVPIHMDLVKILEEKEIVPRNNLPYEASAIAEVITAFVTAPVEIRCNKDKNGKVQLLAVAVCFHKTGHVMKCPEEFYKCAEEIWFPAAPLSA